jgi:hypothetical protein
MLVITHRINLANINYISEFAATSQSGEAFRASCSLPLDKTKVLEGRSLINCLKPIASAQEGRRLRWWKILEQTGDEQDADHYNTKTRPVPVFGTGVIPYAAEVL